MKIECFHYPENTPLAPGASYWTGSRVTQANAVTSQDRAQVQHEDSQEDTPPRRAAFCARKDTHLRSSSASINVMGHHEHVKSLSALIKDVNSTGFSTPDYSSKFTSSPISATVPLSSYKYNATALAVAVDPSYFFHLFMYQLPTNQ
ncbi:hypothetical protein JOM56_007063 [Amanita muscaria]